MLTLTQFFHMNQEVTLKETLNNIGLRDSSYEDMNQALISAPISAPPPLSFPKQYGSTCLRFKCYFKFIVIPSKLHRILMAHFIPFQQHSGCGCELQLPFYNNVPPKNLEKSSRLFPSAYQHRPKCSSFEGFCWSLKFGFCGVFW